MFGKPLVVIECGAGTAVNTVRVFSEHLQKRRNARLIRINPRDPEGPEGTISIPFGALDAIRKISNILKV